MAYLVYFTRSHFAKGKKLFIKKNNRPKRLTNTDYKTIKSIVYFAK